MSTTAESPIFELLGIEDDASAIVVQNIYSNRDSLVAQLQLTDSSAQNFIEVATPLVSSAKALLKNVEAARTKIQEPILRVTREINTKAKEFSLVLQTEVDKSERAIGEIVRRQKQEQERLEREAREKVAEALRVEEERIAALNAKKEGASVFAKGKIDLDIQKSLNNATTVIQQAQQTIQLAAVPILCGGSQVRTGYDVNVVNIQAAYQHHPELFDLVFSKTKFNSWIKLQPAGTTPAVNGLQITPTTKASIR